MKKFLKSLVAVMLVCLMAVSFTSCGISDDPAKVKANLEKEGYKVLLADDAISTGVIAEAYGLKAGDIVASLTATNGDETISIVFCGNGDAAKTVKDKMQEQIDKMDEEDKKDLKWGKSGKAVYMGTAAAVKAAK